MRSDGHVLKGFKVLTASNSCLLRFLRIFLGLTHITFSHLRVFLKSFSLRILRTFWSLVGVRLKEWETKVGQNSNSITLKLFLRFACVLALALPIDVMWSKLWECFTHFFYKCYTIEVGRGQPALENGIFSIGVQALLMAFHESCPNTCIKYSNRFSVRI